ncbi:hypothetical protein BDV97DRAFT_386920 [Delphinella strobiligena]|nr:hypothetical protein BDV97DRAFT_386920 [Delphinella strobiligena]
MARNKPQNNRNKNRNNNHTNEWNNNQNNNHNNNHNNNQNNNHNNDRNNNQNNNQNNNRNNNQNNNQNNNRNGNQNNNQNKNNKQKNNQNNNYNNNNNNNNQNRGNGKPCLNCYKPGHYQNECTAECGNYGLRGHTRNHCPRPGKEHESAIPYCADCNMTNHSTEACTHCKFCNSNTHKTSKCSKQHKQLAWQEDAAVCGQCFVLGHAGGVCRNPNRTDGWNKDEDGKPVAPHYLPPKFYKQPLPLPEVQPLFFNPQAIAPHCERCEAHGVPAILSFHNHKSCQNLRYCQYCNMTTHNDDQCGNAAGQDSFRRAGGAPCARCGSRGHTFLDCLHWNPGEDLTMLQVHSESILLLDSWILKYNLEAWGFKRPRSDIYTTMHNNVSVGLHYVYVPAIVELFKKGFTLRCRRCTTSAILHDPLSEDIVMGSCEANVVGLAPRHNDEAVLSIDCNCFLEDGMVWNRIAPPSMAVPHVRTPQTRLANNLKPSPSYTY